MALSFVHFINQNFKKDLESSQPLSLAGLILLYQQPWAKNSRLDPAPFFPLIQKAWGEPDQGDETSPPEKVIWRGWRKIPGHTGIRGEETSVLGLARQRGFDQCPVCRNLVVKNAMVTDCGHKFCLSCIQDLKTHSASQTSFRCPLCRNPTKQVIASAIIYRNVKQFNCPGTHCLARDMELDEFENHIWFECNSRQIQCECGEKVGAAEWMGHEQTVHGPLPRCECGEALHLKRVHTCNYSTIECKNCRDKVIQKDLGKHLYMACPYAAECNCCGLPGTKKDIEIHQNDCSVGNCTMCDGVFRIDKLAGHKTLCPSRPLHCVVEGCTTKLSFNNLTSHFVTDHPVLVDTGLYSNKPNFLYMVLDTKSLPCIGKKLKETEEAIKFHYLGWGRHYDEWIPKTSLRILSLENNIDRLLDWDSPQSVFPSIFKTEGLGSLIKNDELSHKDVELLCYLEQTYKEGVRAEPDSLEIGEKKYGDSLETEEKVYGDSY